MNISFGNIQENFVTRERKGEGSIHGTLQPFAMWE